MSPPLTVSDAVQVHMRSPFASLCMSFHVQSQDNMCPCDYITRMVQDWSTQFDSHCASCRQKMRLCFPLWSLKTRCAMCHTPTPLITSKRSSSSKTSMRYSHLRDSAQTLNSSLSSQASTFSSKLPCCTPSELLMTKNCLSSGSHMFPLPCSVSQQHAPRQSSTPRRSLLLLRR